MGNLVNGSSTIRRATSGNAFKVGILMSHEHKNNHTHKENTKKNMIQRRRNKRKNNIVRLGCLQPS